MRFSGLKFGKFGFWRALGRACQCWRQRGPRAAGRGPRAAGGPFPGRDALFRFLVPCRAAGSMFCSGLLGLGLQLELEWCGHVRNLSCTYLLRSYWMNPNWSRTESSSSCASAACVELTTGDVEAGIARSILTLYPVLN